MKNQPKQEQATQESAYTQEEVKEIVDEIVATPPRKRIWEVDFVRGLMILFVVWDHFMWDVNDFGPYQSGFFTALYNLSLKYYSGVLRATTHDAFVTMFVFTSGVSCSFSRHNGKRALKMVGCALLFTVVTYAVSAIIHQNVTIYFNVIHVIALSVLLWTAIEWIWSKCDKAWKKNMFGVTLAAVVLTALVVGYCAKKQPWTSDNKIWFFLAEHSRAIPEYKKFLGIDNLSFFPDFGWFLVGAFLGRLLYPQKESLFPSVNPKYVVPVTFCGKYSLWVYIISQLVMYGAFFLFAG